MKIIVQRVPSRNIDHLIENIPDLIICEPREGEGAWDTYVHSLQLAEGEDFIHLEDDVTLAPNFLEEVDTIIKETKGKQVIQFFSRVKEDEKGTRVRKGSTFIYNCCFYIPKQLSQELANYAKHWDRLDEHPTGFDYCVADFLKDYGVDYLNIVPSLVQHNVSVSSLDSRRARDRSSKTFWERVPSEQREYYEKLVYQVKKK